VSVSMRCVALIPLQFGCGGRVEKQNAPLPVHLEAARRANAIKVTVKQRTITKSVTRRDRVHSSNDSQQAARREIEYDFQDSGGS
jgi:hypothetical protein